MKSICQMDETGIIKQENMINMSMRNEMIVTENRKEKLCL